MKVVACIVLLLSLSGCATLPDELTGIIAEPEAPAERVVIPNGTMEIHYLDVGQGDAVLVLWDDATLLIDAGRWLEADQDILRGHLQRIGIEVITDFIITHQDADHSGGCDMVFEEFQVIEFYYPGVEKTHPSKTWQRCLAAANAEGSAAFTDNDLDMGHEIPVSNEATVRVLHIDSTATSNVNEASIVTEVSFGEHVFHFMGDATCRVEDRIIDLGLARDSDVLMVGHHGSSTSTCEPWLDATTPEIAIASNAADNRYGHPHDEVVHNLVTRGIEFLQTSTHGTITITSNGTNLTIETEVTA